MVLVSSSSTDERPWPWRPTSSSTEARKRFEALDAKLTALADDGDTHEVRAGFQALLTSRCFEMSREGGSGPTEEELPALAWKAWWREGGRAWVESYLELGRPGARKVVLPPDVRPVLTRDTAPPDHRLAALLCSAGEAACALETGAWHSRAEAAFRPENWRRSPPLPPEPEPDPLQECERRAREQPGPWRYTTWRRCVNQQDLGGRALPIVRLRAPRDGWLVLRGRRGHYSFCDEVRAYHLASGTAYVSQSCSELNLTRWGKVNGAKTNAGRKARVKVGTLTPERLQALTWMLLIPEAESLPQPWVRTLTVPEGFRVEWRERDEASRSTEISQSWDAWFSSASTRLHWAWFPPERAEPLSGGFTWPASSDPAEDFADVLLEEAEKAFTEGCPPLPPPVDALAFTQPARVNSLDAPGGVERTQDALVDALRAWRPPKKCAADKSQPPASP